MNAAPYNAPPEVARWQNRAFVIGIAALSLSAIGGWMNPEQFLRSYLMAFLFWAGIALGCLALLMLGHISGGAWGLVIRRPLESATRTLPLVLVLFVPVALGMRRLYAWTAPDFNDAHKKLYLNPPFFLTRAAIYFAGWLLLAYVLNHWSRQQDETRDAVLKRKLQFLSAPGLVLYGLLATFAAVDWIMSLDPHWYSSIFGILVIGGQVLSAMAITIAVCAVLARRAPMESVYQPRHFHDLGKLLFAFVMLWAYFAVSQLIIIWSGNLPEEIPWYLHRLGNGWKWVGLLLVVLHFALPFFLLLSRDLKRQSRSLISVAVLLVVMRLVDVYWLTAPDFWPGGLHFHWLDLLLPIGIGGVWLGWFARELRRMPLLPVGDRSMAEALEHEAH